MHRNFLFGSKATRVSNAVAAGTTDINTTALDMEGFDSVVWAVAFGTITATAVTSLKVQVATDSAFTSPIDLVGPTATVADDDDNLLFLVEVVKPVDYRYIRLVIDRGTANAVVDDVIAFQIHARKEPTTHDATTVNDAIVSVSPRASSADFTSTTVTPTGTTTRFNQTRRTSS